MTNKVKISKNRIMWEFHTEKKRMNTDTPSEAPRESIEPQRLTLVNKPEVAVVKEEVICVSDGDNDDGEKSRDLTFQDDVDVGIMHLEPVFVGDGLYGASGAGPGKLDLIAPLKKAGRRFKAARKALRDYHSSACQADIKFEIAMLKEKSRANTAALREEFTNARETLSRAINAVMDDAGGDWILSSKRSKTK